MKSVILFDLGKIMFRGHLAFYLKVSCETRPLFFFNSKNKNVLKINFGGKVKFYFCL